MFPCLAQRTDSSEVQITRNSFYNINKQITHDTEVRIALFIVQQKKKDYITAKYGARGSYELI